MAITHAHLPNSVAAMCLILCMPVCNSNGFGVFLVDHCVWFHAYSCTLSKKGHHPIDSCYLPGSSLQMQLACMQGYVKVTGSQMMPPYTLHVNTQHERSLFSFCVPSSHGPKPMWCVQENKMIWIDMYVPLVNILMQKNKPFQASMARYQHILVDEVQV